MIFEYPQSYNYKMNLEIISNGASRIDFTKFEININSNNTATTFSTSKIITIISTSE